MLMYDYVVLHSYAYHYNLPQTGWLRPTKMYYLGSRGQKSKCQGLTGPYPSEDTRKDRFLVSTLTPGALGVP